VFKRRCSENLFDQSTLVMGRLMPSRVNGVMMAVATLGGK
jgi:hypothetical protein